MMKRKDCDNVDAREGAVRPVRTTPAAALFALAAAALPSSARGEVVRLWPSAVVVGDTVRLSDVCELRGFDRATERTLAHLRVTDAPPPGGSRVVHLEMIRNAMAAGGANMASVVLRGAVRCAVKRPSELTPVQPSEDAHRSPHSGAHGLTPRGSSPLRPASRAVTLRRAVVEYFNKEFAQYGGTADVVFDRTSSQVLDLSGPLYEFAIRRRSGGASLGLVQLEADIVAHGSKVQTVPLVVQVSMTRRVVVARRSINQGATIQPQDVEQVRLSFTRLDKPAVDDVVQVIGQRARRFIPAGTPVDPAALEPVPLVTRGQLVTLTSVAGAVRVVTTASARQDGLLGETITVRSADNKRVEFDAVVVGRGKVQIGPRAVAQRPLSGTAGGDL